jgi:hypothetical protein
MKRILLAALTVIVLTAASCDYNRGIQPSEYTTNENLICSESFYVSSESTDLDTWTMGTIFLSGKDGVVKHAKIIAIVEIDSEDWGGVTITVPAGWNVSSITSSYPEGQDKDPDDFISVWFTANHGYEFNEWILIDTNMSSSPLYGESGGTGTIVIELDATDDASTELFQTTIGVGSAKRNGYGVHNPDHETIEIPLPQEQQ